MTRPPISIPSPTDFGEYLLTERHLEMDGKQVIIHAISENGNVTKVEFTNGTTIFIESP
jgi:hypothetical protein